MSQWKGKELQKVSISESETFFYKTDIRVWTFKADLCPEDAREVFNFRVTLL
jgi:hypothetical protein